VRAFGRFVVAFLIAAAGGAGVAKAQSAMTAEVTYLTGSSVYVGAGTRDGLRPGTRLARVGEPDSDLVLEATETTAHRAVCKVVAGSLAGLRTGEQLSYAPALQAEPGTPGAAPADRPGAWRRSGLHGRIGLRYLATRNGLEGGPDVTQPGLDLRLDGPALYGSPWNFYADVRTRRTTTTRGSGLEDELGRSRVYRLAVGYDRPEPGWRFNLGRQFSPDLANVSVFDGVSAAYDGNRWSAGAFAGTQPDPGDYGHDSALREYGAWYGLRAQPGSVRRWSFSTGVVASYEDSEINREYLFLHARYSATRLIGFLTQEIDVNRGWKKDDGEDSISPTSTFISLRFRAADSVDLLAGYDNRRNVRLYRDHVTPLTRFDDVFRRGVWAGVQATPGNHVRLGLAARTYGGGAAGSADSITVTAALTNLTSRNAFVGFRSTRYENMTLEGWLHSLEGALDLGQRVRFIVQGGVRNDESLINPLLSDEVTWYGIDLDIDLYRRLYLTIAVERSKGDFEEVGQFYGTIAYRF
jgi:hypothetical protein